MRSVEVNAGELMHHTTMHIRITGVRTFRARIWLGVRLISLAARIMGMGVQVETTVQEEAPRP